MKKTILLQTDFTIESLNVLKTALAQSNHDDVFDIILLHGVHLSDSIRDLLFFSKQKIINQLVSEEFEQACFVIKNKYASKINSIRKDIFTGFTQSAFNSYTDANQIDAIYLPANFQWNFNKQKSFDLIPFMNKSKLPIQQIGWQTATNIPEKGKVAELFFNGVPSHS
ncbi:hypothetical protein [Flavobacterium sp. UBA6135]|uniref:hypothetical protein n=1 Tax=Flavobacterium sp. UBA6135 TaxID=1946553 RepID=UPI0025C2B8C3|nr:hypothetical protein [Flavobacterium sp. UBA6135]